MSNARIYIVEDEALIVMAIGDHLTQRGYEICGKAARGEQALEEIPRLRPDLVLMDICLAGKLDGIDTAAKLRQLLDVPVVFLSAFSDTKQVERAIGTGPFGYLVKPVEERELHATIQAALYKHRMECALQDANAGLEEAIRTRTAALAQSEAQLRDLFDGTSNLIQSVALDGQLLFVNRAWRETLGYSADDVAALNIFDVIQAECRDHCRGIMRRISGGENVGLVEISFQTKDGRVVVAEGQVSLRIEDGRPVATRGIFRDITGRKQAETALRALNNRLDFLLSSSPATIYTCEALPPYAATFVSANLTGLLGYTVEEFLSTPGFWADHIHPDDRDRIFAGLPRLFAQGTHLHEYRFQHKDGSWRWMRDALRVVAGQDGKARELIGYFIDITEQKAAEETVYSLNKNLERLVAERTGQLRESEARYRYLMSTVPGAVYEFCVDATGRRSMPFISERIVDVIGLSAADIMADIEVAFQRIPADAMPAMEQSIRHSVEHLSPWLHEFPIRAATGEIKWLRGHSVPSRHENGATYWTGVLVDVTAQKLAENAAEHHRRRIELQITEMPIGHIAWDSGFHVLSWNPAAERIFGYTAEEAISRHGSFIIPEDLRSQVSGIWNRLLTGDRIAHSENDNLTKDGRLITCQWTNTPLRTEDGHLAAAFSMVADITDRRRTEAALRENEARLVHALDATSDGIWDWNIQTGAVYYSPQWMRLLGYQPADVPPAVDFFLTILHPEDMARTMQIMQDHMEGRTPAKEVENRLRVKSGEYRWFLDRGKMIEWDKDGAPLRMVGTITDITERKLAEEQHRLTQVTMDRLSEAIFWIDPAARISYVNDAACLMLGYSKEELLARTIPDIDPNFPAEAWPAHWEELKQRGSFTFESTHQTKEGATLQTEVTVNYLCFDGKEYNCAIMRNVTSRKLADQALRKSEERFRAAYYNASVGMSICDLTGRLQEVNQALCEIFGYSQEELLAKDFQSLTHPDDLPGNLERIQQLLTGAVAHQVFEKRYIRKDGRTIWAHLSLSVIRNPDGIPSHLLAMVQDITTRKQAEEALRENEERYKLLTDATFDGIAIHDQGIMIEVNPGLERMFGYGPGELTGKHILTVVADESRDMVIANMKKGEPGPYESVGLRKDGSTFYGEVVVKPYRYKGREVRLVAGRDITERKRFEDRLRRTQYAIDHATDYIFVIGSDGYFLDVNESACQRLGYTKQELLAKSVMDIDPDFRPAVWSEFWEEFKRLKQMRIETRHRSQSGEIYPVEVVANYIEHNGKELDYAFVRDITERKQTESALQFLSSGIAHLRGDAFFSEMALQVAKLLDLGIGFVGKLLPAQPPRIRAVGLAIDGEALPPMEYELAGTPCERVVGKQTAIFPDQVQQLFPHDRMLVDLGVSGYAAVPLFDMNGQPIGHVGVMSRSPLRQAKQVEDLLRLFAVPAAAELERQRTETKFHDFFEFSPDAIILVNQKGLITLANRQAESLFGYRRAELLNLPVEKLMPESGRQSHVHLRQQFLSSATPRMMGAGRPGLRALRKDGTIFPIDISLSPIQSEDGLLVAAAVRDITERVEAEQALSKSEERFRVLFEQAAVGVAQINTATGRFVRVNQKYCDITGYSQAEMLALNFQQLTHPDDLGANRDNMARLMAEDIREFKMETRCVRKDGAVV